MAANTQFSVAVHILALLARAGDRQVKSDDIAASVNTNPVVIRRLLGLLNQARLVTSRTGAAGGSRLLREPDRIDLAEVYRAVSCGEIFALPTRPASRDCPVGRGMETVMCHLQKEIDGAVSKELSRYSLLDVMRLVEKSGGEPIAH
jgi:Rrf2 family protein